MRMNLHYDLERYSDDPADLSNVPVDEFHAAHAAIVAAACRPLRHGGRACWIVGDVRDGRGALRGFPREVVQDFCAAGCELVDEAILVTACGSLRLRVGSMFRVARKLGRTHQHVLVFRKP